MKLQNNIWFFILGLLFFINGCKGPAEVIEVEPTEERDLSEIVIKPEVEEEEEYKLPIYNESYRRTNDLLHTKLELSFDWEKQHVLGKAWLDFKPLFYATSSLELDAKGFDLHKVQVNGKDAKYDYKNEILIIDLGKEFKASEKYQVFIDYTAKPNERKYGGSSAITSEKGLFFINPKGEVAGKPTQIWTQGETENNSAWFPTIDKPNERTTQEIYLTIEDKYKTLSNGLLESSKPKGNGMREDYWNMDQPHAPYLFMLAIGEFAVVKDDWNGMLVEYYVEPEYEKDAKAIFSNTPEMLTFFSDYIGVKYPWKKYSQVVVRDYVSGAMENTTASIFGEFVQRHERDLIDNHNERIVAHELMHHWFGDYVTCESWANLTMNEGFANYSEYLWFEHKYGRDAADYHLRGEQQGYIASSQRGAHPLIHFGYNDKEDMFDAHSYNKGGAILHMLRKTIGDGAFRAGLTKYLNENKYSAVEAHDLRLAMEDVSGQDLNWFFNQWFFEQGHPRLGVEYGYDAARKEAVVSLTQRQNPSKNPPIFVLPMAVDIYLEDGKAPIRKMITMNERTQEFKFKVDAEPKLIIADAEHYLLAQMTEDKSEEEYIFQFNNAPLFEDRMTALEMLSNSNSTAAQSIVKKALKDDFWAIRNMAIDAIALTEDIMPTIENMAKNDPHSQVKSTALLILGESGNTKYISVAKNAIENERAYSVVAAGLEALIGLDMDKAKTYASKLENEDNSGILAAVATLYASSGDLSKMSFFENKFSKVDGFGAVRFMTTYVGLSMAGGKDKMMEAVNTLKPMALNMSESPYRRYGATNAINELYNVFKNDGDTESAMTLKKYIQEITEAEEMGQLKQMYGSFGR